MELEGVVHNGVIVPDDATALPEGTRVRIIVTPVAKPKPFGERFAQFKGAVPGLPVDLANQHEHSYTADQLLTTEEVAEELGVTPTRVRAMCAAGRLRATKLGRDWLVRYCDLEAARDRQPGRPRTKPGP